MKKYKIIYTILIVVSFSIVLFSSCKEDPPDIPDKGPTAYKFPTPKFFPTDLNIPDDNPTTVEGVKLGRYLFYDGRMSGRTECDSQMSCATCHIQEKGFEVGFDNPNFVDGHPHGIPDAQYPNGKLTPHYPLPLVNLVYNHNGYLWNGLVSENNTMLGLAAYGVPAEEQYHLKNIESLVWMGIVAQHEMNGSIQQTVDMIASIDIYPPMFKDAFGTEEITYDRISKALAQYIRTIISYRTKFHKWLRHEQGVTLEPDEMRGFEWLMSEKADCFHCHGQTALLTTNEFYNNAKDSCFTGPCQDPRDRYGVTKDEMDRGAYKATSLINCELYGPYMHDGRFKTLREVVDFYSDHLVNSPYVDPLMEWIYYGGTHLTELEKDDLIAFLGTLTDHDLLNDPQYSKPADLDTGCN